MFRLAHISDVHLGPLPDVDYRELASKRITGYVNWQRNRRRHMRDSILDAIVGDMKIVLVGSPGDTSRLLGLIEMQLDRQG